jgi:penicillin-binding protein 2
MDKIVNTKSINQWHKLAAAFGFGHKNNIDLPNETAGILPDSTYLDRVLGKGKWGIGDQLSMGIGQGFLSASPLQMALLTAQIANGGYRVQPHLVRAIKENNGRIRLTNSNKKKIKWVNSKEIDVVKEGMRRVVTKGTGRFYAKLDSIQVAGKTGTAQNPHGQDHGWFICFAPFKNPKIAVAVLVENGGFGSISAAPIASLLVEKYLTGEINRPYVYNYVKNFKPRPQKSNEESTDE